MVYVIAYLMIDVFKRAHEKRRKKKGRPCRFCVPYSWEADNRRVYISEEKKKEGRALQGWEHQHNKTGV
jgi:hypothetical protein